MEKMKAILRVVTLGAVGALASACPGETRCDYIDKEVADPERPTVDDVTYCWQGFDEYGLFVFRFQDDGFVWVVDSPSSVLPSGNEQATEWSLVPNPPVPNPPPMALRLGTELYSVEVNTTTMILGGVTRGAMRRAVCTGFGFDTPVKRCRG
jgi:hypothetical protein